jgi:hypothetical protein
MMDFSRKEERPRGYHSVIFRQKHATPALILTAF